MFVFVILRIIKDEVLGEEHYVKNDSVEDEQNNLMVREVEAGEVVTE